MEIFTQNYQKIIKNKLRALIIWMNLCKIRITML